ncbi:MAG: hypothetical protein AAGC60_07330 [Acidobacteriota bacterium]
MAAASPFPGRGLGVQSYVVEEKGRWVVYLDVAMADREASTTTEGDAQGDSVPAFQVVRRRIRDFSSEAEARVAARFMSLGASRDLRRPPSGF